MLTGYVKQTRCGVGTSLGFLFLVVTLAIASFMSLESLQSSLNPHLGIISMSIIYACRALSCLLGPFCIVHLTPKWTIFLSLLMQLVYIGANFYPKWYTLYPTAALAGFTLGPIWIGIGVYITTLAVYYAQVTSQSKSATMSKFNGILALALPIGISIGSVTSSLVFKYVKFNDQLLQNECVTDGDNQTCIDIGNYTLIAAKMMDNASYIDSGPTTQNTTTQWEINYCNINYCPQSDINITDSTTTSGQLPEPKTVYVLLGIYGGMNIVAMVITVCFLSNLPKRDLQSGIEMKTNFCHHVAHYFKSFFNWKYLLLTPSIAYLYMYLAFANSTFNKGFVTCTFGIHWVGITGLIQGITAGVSSYVSGLVGQCIHRNYLLLTAFVLLLLYLGVLLMFDLFRWPFFLLIVACGTGGISAGINNCQYPAFLGDVFTSTKTEAFSFYHFISAVTTAIAYVGTEYLCATHQIYVIFGVMAISFVTYTALSVHFYKVTRATLKLDTLNYQAALQENGPMINQNRSRSIAELADLNGTTAANDVVNSSKLDSTGSNEEPLLRHNQHKNRNFKRTMSLNAELESSM